MKGCRVCRALYTLRYERKEIMRVIEKKMLTAIKTGKSVDLGNTRIVAGDTVKVYLFNNLIAELDFNYHIEGDTELGVNDTAGKLDVITRYQSATTKSRLNAILREFANTSIHQTNYVWFYSDKTYTNSGRTFYGVSK
jgi:hypothetical protein